MLWAAFSQVFGNKLPASGLLGSPIIKDAGEFFFKAPVYRLNRSVRSESVLSQSEVDALLSAVSDEGTDFTGSAEQVRIPGHRTI